MHLILDVKDSLIAEMAKIKPALNFSFTKDDKGKVIQYTILVLYSLV